MSMLFEILSGSDCGILTMACQIWSYGFSLCFYQQLKAGISAFPRQRVSWGVAGAGYRAKQPLYIAAIFGPWSLKPVSSTAKPLEVIQNL